MKIKFSEVVGCEKGLKYWALHLCWVTPQGEKISFSAPVFLVDTPLPIHEIFRILTPCIPHSIFRTGIPNAGILVRIFFSKYWMILILHVGHILVLININVFNDTKSP
jgi:hypothetical protein